MSLISMHGAWLSFSDAPLLDNAELHIEDNERVCLVGRNGAGKSTLMNVLSGVYPYGSYSGRIVFDGKECRFRTINDSEADGIVIIHQ